VEVEKLFLTPFSINKCSNICRHRLVCAILRHEQVRAYNSHRSFLYWKWYYMEIGISNK
jgi:hypothetical protein